MRAVGRGETKEARRPGSPPVVGSAEYNTGWVGWIDTVGCEGWVGLGCGCGEMATPRTTAMVVSYNEIN